MMNTRRRNLRTLADLGFRVADNLPVRRLDEDELPELRPQAEIVGRVLALKAFWLWVDIHPNAESESTVREMIESSQLRMQLTQSELEIIDLSRAEAFAEHGHLMGWKNENCWPLAWVLGFPEIPSVTVGQVSGILGRRLMLEWLPNNSVESRQFAASCRLLASGQVHDLEDLFYCAHNAVRSAQLGEDTVPDDFDPLADGGCIHERRHSLTWMLSPGVSWDDTDLST